LADALARLGSVRALVVHGEPGLDEISPLGITHVVEITNGTTSRWAIDPTDYGFAIATADELAGGNPDENARVIEEILRGGGTAGARAAVVLNAAAALLVGDYAGDFRAAVQMAQAALDAGKGAEALGRLRVAFSASA
jgi:anthranilate phosphoribosyltransferase